MNSRPCHSQIRSGSAAPAAAGRRPAVTESPLLPSHSPDDHPRHNSPARYYQTV
jgi:hypothetical protein